jgi:hypothetical protein
MAKHKRRKRGVARNQLVAEKASAALEKKLREAKNSREVDCPPDFFTEPLAD